MLRNLSIQSKLLLAFSLPIAALFYYLQLTIRDDFHKSNEAEQILRDVQVVEKLSDAIHQFQRERAFSLSFLNSNGIYEKESVGRQHDQTDKSISELNALLLKQKRTIAGLNIMDSLTTVRLKVNSLNMKSESSISVYYLNVKSVLLDEIANILAKSKDVAFTKMFQDHAFLLDANDFLAQTRSSIAKSIVKGGFEGREFSAFAATKGKFELNVYKLRRSYPELRKSLLQKLQEPHVQLTLKVLDSVSNNLQYKIPYKLDEWLSFSGASIIAIKEVSDFSNEMITKKADDELKRANASLFFNLFLASLLVTIIVLELNLFVRRHIEDIRKIKIVADRLAAGDVTQFVEIKTRDELGSLAGAFNNMIAITKDFSYAAEQIGKGDYSAEINVRSKEDLLGKALLNMKQNLKKFSRESKTREWMLAGNNELNEKIRGEKDIGTLAREVITQLTEHLNAQLGAVYILHNGLLTLTGSYAFPRHKDIRITFSPGEGIVGQAALEKKTIILNDLPDDYIRINSGLGNTIPKNIIVFPFLFENELKGVIEIGSTQKFSKLDKEFLHLVAPNLGIAFNTVESRTKLKELLDETQSQTEELEVQQEELRQSNEELHEKNELLEKSETELKAQQEELHQSNEELEEKANLLQEQKEKLENARMEIENKARELEVTGKYKSEFLANMSHELRTPLNSILILSQLLTENKNRSLGEKEVEYARNIYNSGADLLNLIGEILDLSKVEAGRLELDIAEVSLLELIDEINSMFSEVANNKSIAFTISIDPVVKSKAIISDKLRVEQILRNLLSNAFKFTGKGGKVSLIISRTMQEIVFNNKNLNNVNDIISFTVSDTGIGIPEEKQAIIFEAFQQGDGSNKRKYGGTGLGLSISRELANALGGELQLKSKEGKGSAFTLYLPAEFDATLVTATKHSVEVKRTTRKPADKIPVVETNIIDDRDHINENDRIILIVEDDVEFASLLLDLVHERKYKGIIAVQGNTGLSYARLFKPDAIILDMKLPVMEGAEVLKHLKKDPELRHIPVQIISVADQRKEGLELGAFDYLRKPVDRKGLQNAFDRIEEFVKRKLKKLLVVEDNEKQNTAIRELIGNGDVKSFPAFSGKEAFEMLNKDNYDCIIIDLGLPDMTGFELLEKIRSVEQLKKIPVVVYTGKDLTKEENSKLMKFANTVVLKTADSHERLLDETMLFLHRVEARLPKEKQSIIRKLHKTDEVLKNRKILVVDDDIRNIYSLTNVLEEEGIICLTAENGKAALKVLKEDPSIELILMDVMMPEMDGYEATREIRKIPEFSKLPIIALTAKAMKGDREKSLQAGMSDYISKPVNIDQLLSLLRVWLYS